MPNGEKIEPGIKFIDIRSAYEDEPVFQELKKEYEATGTTDTTELNYHRFWHEGDALMAYGAMALLYPDMKIDSSSTPSTSTTPDTPDVTLWGDANCDGKVDISDAVLIKCYLINSENYKISAQGKANADVQGNGNGINAQDAVAIQKYILKLVSELPVA